ncbi:MAG: hypothetical protein WC690_00050 [bacterium]
MKRGEKSRKIRGSSEKWLLDVCRLLGEQGAKYIVVGGVACNLHGLMRATKDIDLLIPKDVENAQAVLEALGGLAFGISKELDAAEVASKPITIIGDIPRVDLLTVANKVKYEQAIATARRVKVNGVAIVFAGFDILLKTKNTDRLQDQADIERLKQIKGK